MLEAVTIAITDATEHASAEGVTGYELQARVFMAAFNAAIKGPEEAAPAPAADPVEPTDDEPGSENYR